jgi:Protein phosphatase 2C
MMWAWVGACATGSSHVRAGSPCQDRAGCLEIPSAGQPLLAVVSDGAGSADFSEIGSRIVVNTFTRCAVSHFKSGAKIESITEELVREWLDDIRNRIFWAAEQRNVKPRELAATLVAAIVSTERAVIAHVGDGACALRKRGGVDWEVPSWPAHGEYASATFFVTDDPEPTLHFVSIEEVFSEIAIFSDGLERLALDFSKNAAFAPFFDSKFLHLSNLGAGRNRSLSRGLRRYLDSAPILERTDDDKSLILARRVVQQ